MTLGDFERVANELIRVKEENKILKENAENNDKVLDNVNWEKQLLKKKYENAVSDYETTMAENQELKKQLEEYIKQNMKLKDELFDKRKEYQDTYKDVRIEIKEYKTQQKEFINYLEDEISKQKNDIFANALTSEDIDLYIMKIKLQELEEVLQKYKEIIGDINDKK